MSKSFTKTYCFLVLYAFFFGADCPGFAKDLLKWSELPSLPPAAGQLKQPGLAGPFVGVHKDALIVAGGANFPDAPPWQGGKKVWWDDIYVLEKNEYDSYSWIKENRFKLHHPLAYGVSISTAEGVVCIGGCDQERCYSDVFMLKWDPEAKEITIESLPSLPRPLAFMAGALVGDTVYIAGGQETMENIQASKNFFALDLTYKNQKEKFVWKELPSWPGSARVLPVAAAQSNGARECFYLFSGRNIAPGKDITLLHDAYRYIPEIGGTGQWQKISDTFFHGNSLPCVMGGAGIALGQSHILILGGDDGSLFLDLEQSLPRAMERAEQKGQIQKVEALKQKKFGLLNAHPGFSRDILAYHTITDTWIKLGELPFAGPVTTLAVKWDDSIIFPSGEIRPGVRTPQMWQAEPVTSQETFGIINFATIGIYLLAMVGIGVFFSFRNRNTDDYFRGGQRIPWFAAGLSIFATMLSSITYLAIPAKAYATNWAYFLVNMTAIAVAPFIIMLFLPFFRRIDATSAYEYLEKRFNVAVRLFGSVSFSLFQIGRMAVVMYLPALALAVILPISEQQCILIMGILSIIYCTMGGIKAVIWTDTIQTFVLLGGALLSLILIVFQIDGGIKECFSLATSDQKFHVVNWNFSTMSFTTTALWVVVLGGIGQNLVPYASDQALIQRYMSVSDAKKSARAIWTNAIAVFPATLLFFSVGTALYVFYKMNPARLDPTFKTDAIFPLFIARELPVGVAGLIVAGVFAAAQSTISTSMNSTATVITTDFVRRFHWLHSEKAFLNLARILTLVLGTLGTALALWFASSDIYSLWDQFMKILGLIGGPLCGLFCLGIFTKRGNSRGALLGAFLGAFGLYGIQYYTEVHFLLYATLGIWLSFSLGYLGSLILLAPKADLSGLTIYTTGKYSK
jgi:solute:Na+ symporter, SSS family